MTQPPLDRSSTGRPAGWAQRLTPALAAALAAGCTMTSVAWADEDHGDRRSAELRVATATTACPARAPRPGETASGIEVARLGDGRPVTLGSLGVGRKPTVLQFWARWCDPCVAEMPDLAALHARYGDRVQFLGIAREYNKPYLRASVAETGKPAGFEHYLDIGKGQTVEQRLLGSDVTALPATAVLGADGRPRAFTVGAITSPERLRCLEQQIAAVLREEKK